MIRYFFDVHDGLQVIDNQGCECADLDEARSEALKVASAFAADPKHLGEDGGAVVVSVRDGPNHKVMDVRLAFSVQKLNSASADRRRPSR